MGLISSCLQSEQKNLINELVLKKNKLFIVPNVSFKEQFLRSSVFYAEYPGWVVLQSMPYSVVTLPFVMSMLPVILVSNQTWTVEEIDQDFYETIPLLRHVFKLFYPSLEWSGQLQAKKIVKNERKRHRNNDKVALLFSGGLDAICSSFMHRDKKQLLITLHGYDIPFTKKTMWENVQEQCHAFAQTYGHDLEFIRFNVRSLLDVRRLAKISSEIPVWIEYTSESLSHTGITAPLLYQRGYSHLLMASSVTIDFPFPYGTHPALDNFIEFAGVDVCHDGDILTRLEKLKMVKTIAEKQNIKKPSLRVCWGNDRYGGNCGRCEKCLRTIHEILVLGEDLKTWGFNFSLIAIKKSTKQFLKTKPYIGGNWLESQAKAFHALQQTPQQFTIAQQKYLTWFCKLDLEKFHIISEKYKKKRPFYEKIWLLAQQRDKKSIMALS